MADWNQTSLALPPSLNVVLRVAPASVLVTRAAEAPKTSFTASPRAPAAVTVALPAAAGSDLSGEPCTEISRPFLATFALRPLPKTGIPSATCTKLRWWMPAMST